MIGPSLKLIAMRAPMSVGVLPLILELPAVVESIAATIAANPPTLLASVEITLRRNLEKSLSAIRYNYSLLGGHRVSFR